ncbi:MAG: hypothetical protein R2713_17805 [Ilumatobacteraceae bacterium]
MTTEWRYIQAFRDQFVRCGLADGEVVTILSETQSRPVLVETARLAAQSLGGRVSDVVVPLRRRSTRCRSAPPAPRRRSPTTRPSWLRCGRRDW